jgi:GntP family gluconate:H+ symporter
MMQSGAADRIVRMSLRVLGERRASVALMISGFILAIPVFFDTVFYLMIPLARSLYRQTGKNFVLYVMAISAGGAATHTLVPPTPGPLAVAGTLDVPLGTMILVGLLVAFPAAVLGEWFFSRLVNRLMPVPMRPISGMADPDPMPEEQLPSFWLAILPIILPVLLISADTTVDALLRSAGSEGAGWLASARGVTALVGNPNLALLISTVLALVMLQRQRGVSLLQLDRSVETALMSAGVIILITAGGGAFGKMLEVAGVGGAVEKLFASESGTSGVTYLYLAYSLAAVLKVAQGSSTVAMITTAGLFQGILGTADVATTLGFHPVYLATTIAAGSLMGSWMNDSGFWVFARMSGLTESETLRTWTPLLAFLSLVGLAMSLVCVRLLPLI